MDQNGGSSSSAAEEIENSSSNTNRCNKYTHLFTKKTLQFLVPVSVISFLLAYVSCFSFIFTYNFHFSTLLLALFSRAIERKYMFLICNGILAFLVKTLSFNSCSPPPPPPPHVSDFIHDESIKTTEDQKPKSSVPYEEAIVLPVQYYNSCISKNLAVEDEEEEEEKQEKEVYINVRVKLEEKAQDEGGKQSKSQMGSSSWIIASDEIYSSEDDDYETDIEESATAATSLLGKSSVAEEGNEINLNTEELNQKFEEFIRKMKEEIRIEAQQQLVVA